MNLCNVHETYRSETILYALLHERTPEQSISHKRMPSVADHEKFVFSIPYLAWYLIEVDGEYVGAVYLSDQREIGVSIFSRHRGNGYGTQAVNLLMQMHPGRFLANINPSNDASIKFFEKLGFKHIQNTYSLDE